VSDANKRVPPVVAERIDNLRDDVESVEEEQNDIRSDVTQIKVTLYFIAGALAGDMIGLREILMNLL